VPDQIITSNSPDVAPAENAQNQPPPPFNQTSAAAPAPSPADLAARAPASPAAPAPEPHPGDDTNGDGGRKGKKLETIEDYEKALADARRESAERRVKLRELEPLADKYRQIEESQKDELTKEREARIAAEERDQQRAEDFDRLNLAVTHGIEPDNIDLIGSGSREQMEQRALRVKAMQDAKNARVGAPPSDRPVEGLRPGASPEPPKPADDSYPESWKPNHIRERERSQYGQ
jgi:hypothetical protein